MSGPLEAWNELVDELSARMSPDWVRRARENADQT